MPTIDQFRTLLALQQNDFSVTETARSIGTSQPGVSRRILALEMELGVELLQRRGRHIQGFSPIGEQVADNANNLLRSLENLTKLAADYHSEEVGELNVVTTHTQARYALPEAVAVFLQRYPEVRLQLHQAPPDIMANMLRNGEADLAIATESFEHFDDLIVLPCYRWQRCLVVPADHRLASETALSSLKDLQNERLITYSFGLTGRDGVLAQCRQQGLEPDIALTATDAEVIKRYIRAGLGLGLIACMAVDDLTDSDLTCLDMSAFFPLHTTCIALRRDSRLRSFTQFFITAFAPHLTVQTLKRAQAAQSRKEVKQLFAGLKMDIR